MDLTNPPQHPVLVNLEEKSFGPLGLWIISGRFNPSQVRPIQESRLFLITELEEGLRVKLQLFPP